MKMILIFASFLCFLGGIDAQLACASCNDYQDDLFPSGSSFPRVKLVFNSFIGDDGCKVGSFKCISLEKGYNSTAVIMNPTTGEQLATFAPSQTESIGGNITCVASSNSADWRFNGVESSIHCGWSWTDGFTVRKRTSPQPTTPTTTTTTVKPTTTTSDCGQ
ncbi:hypothetical protein L3Y34_009928 [Caenorhabditis briggsae]|uniref:C6 domain-containing protein n=2 Tax=Caenorhabditis briggsae TaxID=6238 RepID=A0AAE9AA26_CAEBR|nr:hypothetical protein L3Y34_009928 [Caenorhabditis briggsae]